jgi:hypothetical protein
MELPRTIDKRAERIEGIRVFADFAETHPDLPLGLADSPLHVSVTGGTDEENRAEVDRIAAILGVTAGYGPYDRNQTRYTAVQEFGGSDGVTYTASALSAAYSDMYDAWASYRGSVEPAVVRRVAA